jgi:hypothetical protein
MLLLLLDGLDAQCSVDAECVAWWSGVLWMMHAALPLPRVCVPLPCLADACPAQLVHICTRQLDAWAAAPSPVDLRSEGKALSFEFSTQLLVSFSCSGQVALVLA